MLKGRALHWTNRARLAMPLISSCCPNQGSPLPNGRPPLPSPGSRWKHLGVYEAPVYCTGLRGAPARAPAPPVLRKSIPLCCPLRASNWYHASMISWEMAFLQVKTPHHWLFCLHTPSTPGKVTLEAMLISQVPTQAVSCTSPQWPVHLLLPASRPEAGAS